MRFNHFLSRFGRWFSGKSRPMAAKTMFQRRLELEGLEERTLLAASINPSGILVVNGDDFGVTADTIVLRNNATNANLFEVVVNGQIQLTEPISVVTQVLVNSGGGADTITVQNLAATSFLAINAGDASDTINVGAGNLDMVHGTIIVDGQGGSDIVNLNDTLSLRSKCGLELDEAAQRSTQLHRTARKHTGLGNQYRVRLVKRERRLKVASIYRIGKLVNSINWS